MITYILFCEPCGFKKLVTNPNDVGEHKLTITDKFQGKFPQLDNETKKVDKGTEVTVMPKYRCPQCGRGVILKKFNVPLPQNQPSETPNESRTEDGPENQVQ